MGLQINALDRMLLAIAPAYALNRIRARALAVRNYDASTPGRRTDRWRRTGADANLASGPSLIKLREHARDLIRNNAWARNGVRVIGRNTVGWGIIPKPMLPKGTIESSITPRFREWSTTPQCDAAGESTLFGMQRQLMDATVESGEVLVRRRPRRRSDGLAIPLQLQVLEADFLDTMKDGIKGPSGGNIVQGVEFDQLGKRVAYWLFQEHPGSGRGASLVSQRVLAENVIHMRKIERPGQVRGPTWFAPIILGLKDLDEYEDATLMKQKLGALFSAFVTDTEGDASGEEDEDDEHIEEMSPGTVQYLTPGREVSFSSPPQANDFQPFTAANLRKAAAGLGVSYEELTNDFSQVNFSSARMGRLAHYANVHDWRWNMLIPQFCDRVWAWAMEAAAADGTIAAPVAAQWTPPPIPMLEPDKEALALMRRVRIGELTPDEMIREMGGDPDTHWQDYRDAFARLDQLEIVLDSDPRKMSQAGLTQERAGQKAGAGGAGPKPVPAPEPSGDVEDEDEAA